MSNVQVDPITNDDELRMAKFFIAEMEAFWRIPGYIVMPPSVYQNCKELESLTRQQIEKYERETNASNNYINPRQDETGC